MNYINTNQNQAPAPRFRPQWRAMDYQNVMPQPMEPIQRRPMFMPPLVEVQPNPNAYMRRPQAVRNLESNLPKTPLRENAGQCIVNTMNNSRNPYPPENYTPVSNVACFTPRRPDLDARFATPSTLKGTGYDSYRGQAESSRNIQNFPSTSLKRDGMPGSNQRLLSLSSLQLTVANANTPVVNPVGTQASGNLTDNLYRKIYGSTEGEKMFIFTGTVERVIKWNKIFQNHFCYFEVIGAVVSIQEGSVRQQKIMLLRDKKGPILQVVYYASTHIDIEDFYVGKMLRCVGTLSGQNMFNAVSIRSATEEEVEILQRLSLICDQAVSHFLNV